MSSELTLSAREKLGETESLKASGGSELRVIKSHIEEIRKRDESLATLTGSRERGSSYS